MLLRPGASYAYKRGRRQELMQVTDVFFDDEELDDGGTLSDNLEREIAKAQERRDFSRETEGLEPELVPAARPGPQRRLHRKTPSNPHPPVELGKPALGKKEDAMGSESDVTTTAPSSSASRLSSPGSGTVSVRPKWREDSIKSGPSTRVSTVKPEESEEGEDDQEEGESKCRTTSEKLGDDAQGNKWRHYALKSNQYDRVVAATKNVLEETDVYYNPAFLWRKAGGSARASKPVKKRIDWLTHIAGRCSMLTDVDGSASDLANSCMEMAEMLRDQLSFYEAVRLNAMEVATQTLSRSSLAAIKAARKDSALLPNILTCLVSNIVANNKEITCAECNAALSVLVHTKEADNMLHISELREEKHRKHVQSNGVIMLAEKLGELSKEKFVEVMGNVNPQHLPEKANNIFYNTQAISKMWFMQAFTDLCFLNVAKRALKKDFKS